MDRKFEAVRITNELSIKKYTYSENDSWFWADASMVYMAVRSCPSCIKYATDEIKHNLDVCLRVLKLNQSFQHLPEAMKTHPSIILKYIKNGKYYEGELKIPDELISNHSFLLKMIDSNVWADQFIPDFYQRTDLMIYHLKKYPNRIFNSSMAQNNYDLILEAVKLDGTLIRFASDELKNNRILCLEAVKNNSKAFDYIPRYYWYDDDFYKLYQNFI